MSSGYQQRNDDDVDMSDSKADSKKGSSSSSSSSSSSAQDKPVVGLDEPSSSSSSGDDKDAKSSSEGKDAKSVSSADLEEELTLVAKDQTTKFTLPRKTAFLSVLVQTMAEGDKDEKTIPLPSVTGPVLTKVVEYIKYHTDTPAKAIEKPIKSAKMNENVSQWDADFIDVDNETLFDLILAANYMDIEPLLDLGCAKVASMIRGKSVEELRKTFNIVNDYTAEEEVTVRGENKWAEEI